MGPDAVLQHFGEDVLQVVPNVREGDVFTTVDFDRDGLVVFDERHVVDEASVDRYQLGYLEVSVDDADVVAGGDAGAGSGVLRRRLQEIRRHCLHVYLVAEMLVQERDDALFGELGHLARYLLKPLRQRRDGISMDLCKLRQ